MRAYIIMAGCGLVPSDRTITTGSVGPLALPDASLADVSAITAETDADFPHVTESESMVWSNGDTIVVNYNDSKERFASPIIISNLSVSTDGGATFTRFQPSPLRGAGRNNFGDPIVVFNANVGKWFAGDLVSGCGAQGIGMWESQDAQSWTVGVE
jgi:hypothetical protein